MNQYYEEKFFESVIIEEDFFTSNHNRTPQPHMVSYRYGYLAGMREVIRLFAAQVGKPMKDGESIVEYYKRWLSLEYSMLDIPNKMKTLEEEIRELDRAKRASWHGAKDIMLD